MQDERGLIAPEDAARRVQQKQSVGHGIGDLLSLRDLGVAVFHLLRALLELRAHHRDHVVKRAVKANRIRLAQQLARRAFALRDLHHQPRAGERERNSRDPWRPDHREHKGQRRNRANHMGQSFHAAECSGRQWQRSVAADRRGG